MSRYFDTSGQPMSFEDWARAFEDTDGRIAATTCPDGTLVSTVWLGLDHGPGRGPPLIFETVAFRDGNGVDCERYATLDEARVGHREMVAKWSAAEGEPIARLDADLAAIRGST